MTAAKILLTDSSTVGSPNPASLHLNNLGSGGTVICAESDILIDQVTDDILINELAADLEVDEATDDIAITETVTDLAVEQPPAQDIEADDPQIGINIDGPALLVGDDAAVSTNVTLGSTVSTYDVVAVVAGSGVRASSSDLSHVASVIGIAAQSGVASEVIAVQTGDEITNPAWSWNTSLPLWLGLNGAMTQTQPLSGFIQRVGKPLSPTTVLIDIDEPIEL